MEPERRIAVTAHDDGVNAWRTARVAAPAALAGAVRGYADYWERTCGFTTRRELPHGEGVLIVNLGAPIVITGGDGGEVRLAAGEAFVAGVHLRPALSTSTGAQAGIHVFLPLATLRRLARMPMDRLTDRAVPLDALLGPAARRLGDRLGSARDGAGRIAALDAVLGDLLRAAPSLDRRQAHALHLLDARPERDLAALADDVGWSRKHFAARVRNAVGVGPRSFRRVRRFEALTRSINTHVGPIDWAGLAHDTGYCDQSHMIREFGEFSGLTPTAYLARTLPAGGGLVET